MDLIEAKYKTNASRHPWEGARLNVLKYFLNSSLLVGNSNPVIVDIGCGDTYVIESLSKLYPHGSFIAVDTGFTNELLELYQQKHKANNIFLYKHIDDVPNNTEADIVLLMDVIEHIEDDIGFLKHICQKKFIHDKTKWFITVPAFETLFCSHDVFLGHFRRYNNKELVTKANSVGLKVHQVGYFFFCLLLPRFVQAKILLKRNSNTTDLVDWNGSQLKTKLIQHILYLDFRICKILKLTGISMPGLSNYLIASR